MENYLYSLGDSDALENVIFSNINEKKPACGSIKIGNIWIGCYLYSE
jgi:hypothetical protein